MKYEELGKGIVKRTGRRVLGLFIDGTGLDRATRRINRKVDMSALIRGVTSGITPTVARYYTLIPYEDDSRQRAFLDAVSRAGLNVVVKRLPPKGVTRQVSVDVEIAADIIAFALGHFAFGDLSVYRPDPLDEGLGRGVFLNESPAGRIVGLFPPGSAQGRLRKQQTPAAAGQGAVGNKPASGPDGVSSSELKAAPTGAASKEASETVPCPQRIVTVVCPGRDLTYPISLVKELGVDTVTADFGQFNSGDILKSAAKWIDLSDSETIWRE